MNPDIYIYVSKGNNNVIYNAITDPLTGRSCYPDILVKHNFSEQQITDGELYNIASNVIGTYGSSRCFFICYKEYEPLIELLRAIQSVYNSNDTFLENGGEDLIRDFGNSLMLSTTMMNSLKVLLNYHMVTGGNLQELICNYSDAYELPVTTKLRGKQIYELIRTEILS